MKADTSAGGTSITKNMPPVHGEADSCHKEVGRFDHERPSSAEQGRKKNRKEERKDPRFGMIVAVEQWICLLLGVVCIASGARGVFLKLSQNALPAYLAWLATAYPTLRITAVASLVMRFVLVRHGLA